MNLANKHLKHHDPLRVNTKYKTYFMPIIKIVLSLAVIAVAITWKTFWEPSDSRVEAVISLVGLLLSFVNAYIICVAVGELGFVAENRERAKMLERNPSELVTKRHSAVEILERFDESRDTELLIAVDGRLAYIGVKTAYSKAAGYHDKKYYINDDDYDDPDHFADVLTALTHSAREINVVSIDGKSEK